MHTEHYALKLSSPWHLQTQISAFLLFIPNLTFTLPSSHSSLFPPTSPSPPSSPPPPSSLPSHLPLTSPSPPHLFPPTSLPPPPHLPLSLLFPSPPSLPLTSGSVPAEHTQRYVLVHLKMAVHGIIWTDNFLRHQRRAHQQHYQIYIETSNTPVDQEGRLASG